MFSAATRTSLQLTSTLHEMLLWRAVSCHRHGPTARPPHLELLVGSLMAFVIDLIVLSDSRPMIAVTSRREQKPV